MKFAKHYTQLILLVLFFLHDIDKAFSGPESEARDHLLRSEQTLRQSKKFLGKVRILTSKIEPLNLDSATLKSLDGRLYDIATEPNRMSRLDQRESFVSPESADRIAWQSFYQAAWTVPSLFDVKDGQVTFNRISIFPNDETVFFWAKRKDCQILGYIPLIWDLDSTRQLNYGKIKILIVPTDDMKLACEIWSGNGKSKGSPLAESREFLHKSKQNQITDEVQKFLLSKLDIKVQNLALDKSSNNLIYFRGLVPSVAHGDLKQTVNASPLKLSSYGNHGFEVSVGRDFVVVGIDLYSDASRLRAHTYNQYSEDFKTFPREGIFWPSKYPVEDEMSIYTWRSPR